VLDGDRAETEPPLGAAVPSVVAWTDPDGGSHEGDEVEIPSEDAGEWSVLVRGVPDATLRIDLRPTAVDGGAEA
jgi:hypothetical protein